MIHVENMQRAQAAELERKRGELTIIDAEAQQMWVREGFCHSCEETTTVLNCESRYDSGTIAICQDCITSSFKRFEEGQRDAKTDSTN